MYLEGYRCDIPKRSVFGSNTALPLRHLRSPRARPRPSPSSPRNGPPVVCTARISHPVVPYATVATHLHQNLAYRASRPDSREQEAMEESLEDSRDLQQLSEKREQHWTNILLELDAAPVPASLQNYFTMLKKGLSVSDWTIEKYIEGMLRFAKLYGPEKGE